MSLKTAASFGCTVYEVTRLFARSAVAVGGLMVVLAACSGGGGGSSSRSSVASATGPSPSAGAGATSTAAADGSGPATTGGPSGDEVLAGDPADLYSHLDDPKVVAAAGAVLDKGSAADDLRFAAAWVWANGADDPGRLLPLVGDKDPSIAMTAAIGLVAQGRLEGFAPLIAALTVDTRLNRIGAAEPAWTTATVALVEYTALGDFGPPFDAVAGQRVLAQKRWQAWLDANAATLKFDPATASWSVP